MTYETRSLSDIEFPVYFSLYSTPGYNQDKLNSFGFRGEFILFIGIERYRNNTVDIIWRTEDKMIAGSLLKIDMNNIY